jgi:hypothetical protein
VAQPRSQQEICQTEPCSFTDGNCLTEHTMWFVAHEEALGLTCFQLTLKLRELSLEIVMPAHTRQPMVSRTVVSGDWACDGFGFANSCDRSRKKSLARREGPLKEYSVGVDGRAFEPMRAAATLEPQSPLYQTHVSWILYNAGRTSKRAVVLHAQSRSLSHC